VLVIEEKWVGDSPQRAQTTTKGGAITYRGFHWWPLPQMSPSRDTPKDISECFSEAASALYANCPRAAAVMARRTLEAVCADKKETQGTLAQRLESLRASGVLLPTLADWAKEVRLIGNAGAHFDPIQTVTIEDAGQLAAFVTELLKYLYELPGELARRRGGKTPAPGTTGDKAES
jgi:hypothetical protein